MHSTKCLTYMNGRVVTGCRQLCPIRSWWSPGHHYLQMRPIQYPRSSVWKLGLCISVLPWQFILYHPSFFSLCYALFIFYWKQKIDINISGHILWPDLICVDLKSNESIVNGCLRSGKSAQSLVWVFTVSVKICTTTWHCTRCSHFWQGTNGTLHDKQLSTV